MKTIKELEAEIKKGSPAQLVLQERINTMRDVLKLIDEGLYNLKTADILGELLDEGKKFDEKVFLKIWIESFEELKLRIEGK